MLSLPPLNWKPPLWQRFSESWDGLGEQKFAALTSSATQLTTIAVLQVHVACRSCVHTAMCEAKSFRSCAVFPIEKKKPKLARTRACQFWITPRLHGTSLVRCRSGTCRTANCSFSIPCGFSIWFLHLFFKVVYWLDWLQNGACLHWWKKCVNQTYWIRKNL